MGNRGRAFWRIYLLWHCDSCGGASDGLRGRCLEAVDSAKTPEVRPPNDDAHGGLASLVHREPVQGFRGVCSWEHTYSAPQDVVGGGLTKGGAIPRFLGRLDLGYAG